MFLKSLLTTSLALLAANGPAVASVHRSTESTSRPSSFAHKAPVMSKRMDAAQVLSAPVAINPSAKAPAKAYPLPFSMQPTKEQMEQECVIIDNNHDANGRYNTWSYVDEWGSPIYWAQDPAGDADDWLIFPAVTIPDPSKIYEVTIGTRCTVYLGDEVTNFFESFEIRIGKAPEIEALTQVILSEPVLRYSPDFKDYSSKFGVAEAGDYYVAVHCTSTEINGWRLPVRDLRIKEVGGSAMLPAVCTDLSATPNPKGELSAKVTFKMPSTSLNGTALSASKDLTAKITTGAGTTTTTGKPGQTVSAEVPCAAGINSVSVSISNEYGEGMSVGTSVRCGLDIPVNPSPKATVSDDNYSMTISWEKVDKGIYGGVVDPDGVKYDVFIYNPTSEEWEIYLPDLTATSFEASVEEGTPLGYLDFAVASKNDAGQNLQDVVPVSELLGKPYPLPVDETLEGQSLHYTGLVIATPTDEYKATFMPGDPATVFGEAFANDKQGALMGIWQEATGPKGQLILPKCSTVGAENLQVILPVFLYAGTPEIKVYAKTNTGEPLYIGEVDNSRGLGWTNLIFNLPESLNDKKCISVILDITFENKLQYFLMEGYTIKEGVANDKAITNISIFPSPLTPGETATVTATVVNNGTNPCDTPALEGTVTCQGTQIATLTFTPQSTGTMAMLDSREYKAEFTLNSSEFIGSNLTFTARLTSPDADASNDKMTAVAKVAPVAQPVINDLRATYDEATNVVTLSWSNPVKEFITDGFEFLTPFIYDSKLGNWLNLDFDRGTPYTLADVEGVTIPNDTEPKAFQVINFALSGLSNYNFVGSGGSQQVLMAFSPQGATADDWLISPEVKGGSQLSFMYDIISSDNAETIEVYYSTTNREVDSFTGKLTTVTKGEVGWQEVAVELPADAKYFAIHYCSHDSFGILIDDVTYYPVAAEYQLASYRLMRDGKQIATPATDATSHTDTDVKLGNSYTYQLLPTFTHNGKSEEGLYSNAASVSATGVEDVAVTTTGIFGLQGAISIIGHEGEQIIITDLQGRVLKQVTPATASQLVPMQPGIYLAASTKVIVK